MKPTDPMSLWVMLLINALLWALIVGLCWIAKNLI
jgi:hypothetical protein